jgi:hypothetical protein
MVALAPVAYSIELSLSIIDLDISIYDLHILLHECIAFELGNALVALKCHFNSILGHLYYEGMLLVAWIGIVHYNGVRHFHI